MPEDLLERLAASCPMDLGESDPRTVTQDEVDVHARTTGDAQWIHNDPERAARESPFGGPVVQGFFLLALLTELSSGLTFPDVGPVTMMVNYGFDRVRFVRTVPVGAAVRLRGTLVGVERRPPDRAILSVDIELVSDAVDGPAVVARWLFLAQR
ncbi:MAG: MaoC family dehydratase [Actinomycetota bacterium]|nr:MaoC family dehydratase [Actinomycetota bacterium]